MKFEITETCECQLLANLMGKINNREREREGERERERERGKFQNCCGVFKIDFSNLRQNLVTLSRMFSLTKVPTSA